MIILILINETQKQKLYPEYAQIEADFRIHGNRKKIRFPVSVSGSGSVSVCHRNRVSTPDTGYRHRIPDFFPVYTGTEMGKPDFFPVYTGTEMGKPDIFPVSEILKIYF